MIRRPNTKLKQLVDNNKVTHQRNTTYLKHKMKIKGWPNSTPKINNLIL